jgi:hypothetical protein
MVAEFLRKHRRLYFFGYGANRDPEMIAAIIGHRPKVIGKATLENYQLRIQSFQEIPGTTSKPLVLLKSWGQSFKSYEITPQPGSKVSGTLFRITLHDRHLIDKWEFADTDWHDKVLVKVRLQNSGKTYPARTLQLGAGQRAKTLADGMAYDPWLQPKSHFIRMAEKFPKS